MDENQKIWRYVDFDKLVDLLVNKSLYFCRASSLSDPFEGAVGLADRRGDLESGIALANLLDSGRLSEDTKRDSSEGNGRNLGANALREANAYLKKMQQKKHISFVNCWCASSYESDAMWKLFCTDIRKGIALQTTIAILKVSLEKSSKEIEIGEVEYIDYRTRFPKPRREMFTKRIAFQHEWEVRAVICDENTTEKGIRIPIDVNTLVESIVISPVADDWFVSIVKDLVNRFDVDVPVRHSELVSQPF